MIVKPCVIACLAICVISTAVFASSTKHGYVSMSGIKCISIENDHAGYYFNAATLDLVDIRDKRQKISYIQESGQGIFSIGVPFASQASYQTDQPRLITSNSAKKKRSELLSSANGKTLILHYDGCEINENGSSMNVTVTLTLDNDESVAKWNLKIDSTQAVTLGETHFPIISGIGTSVKNKHEKEYIAVPYYGGTMRENPRANLVCNQGWTNYPGGGMTLQLLTYCDGIGKGSLYLASYDAEGYRKTFTCEPRLSKKAFTWYVMHYPEKSDAVSSWNMPYSVACGPIQGDWYNAAKLYREWSLSNPMWKPLSKSTDPYSKWFRDTMLWNSGIYGLPNCSPEWFRKFNNKLGQTSAYHWYSWWKDPRFDHDYPNYFPANPKFKETLDKTKPDGLYSIPYMNMHLFETQLPIWKELKAEDWVCRDVKGEMVHYFWDIPTSNPKYPGEVKKMVQMCRGSKGWQDYAVSIPAYEASAIRLQK